MLTISVGLSGHNHSWKGIHPSLLKVVEKFVLEDTEWVCTTKEASLKVDLCLLRINLEAARGRGRSKTVWGPGLGELGRIAIARYGLATGPGDTVHHSTDAGSKNNNIVINNIRDFNFLKIISYGFEDRNLVELPADKLCNLRVINRCNINDYELYFYGYSCFS